MTKSTDVAQNTGDIQAINMDILTLREKVLKLEKNLSNNGITECINQFKEIHAKMIAWENVLDSENVQEVVKLFQATLDNFNHLIMDLENPEKQIQSELEAIVKGDYQDILAAFISDLPQSREGSRLRKETMQVRRHTVYPLMDKEAFHCTAAIPNTITTYPIEIQINFMGTIDLASRIADLEKGGPGQETLQKYETELLAKVNTLVDQVSKKYPDAPLRLRIAGQSLGGALAKGFTHSLQRACAVQVGTPQAIINTIETNVAQSESTAAAFSTNKKNLLKKLTIDAQQFKGLAALKKISGITVYALAAPGVSVQTDRDATLLTYYQAPNFLRVYNHFHKEDIIPKFGESEFLSGNYGIPQVLVHKAIVFDCKLNSKNVVTLETLSCLPFPGITRRVIEAHLVNLFCARDMGIEVTTSITNLIACQQIKEKLVFPWSLRKTYDHMAFGVKTLARSKWLVNKIEFLYSHPNQEIPNPKITEPTLNRFEPLRFGDQKLSFFKMEEGSEESLSPPKLAMGLSTVT